MAVMKPNKERAALLLYEDTLSDKQIAADVGVTRKTLAQWKKEPVFAARVQALRAEFAGRIVAEGIANKQNRIDELKDLYERTKRVTTERAADESMQDVPGGTTGTVVRTWKQVGTGDNAQIVEEYRVDTATNRDLRDTMKQVAIEQGEWTEKSETKHEGEILVRRYIGVDLDKI